MEQRTNRIRPDELKGAIFRPQSIEGDVVNTPKTLVFSMIGQHHERIDIHGDPDNNGYPGLKDEEYDDESYVVAEDLPQAYAKCKYNKELDRIDYYVRIDASRQLYDPNTRQHDRHIKNAYINNDRKFRSVGRHAFILYLNFLKTKNIAWLRQAEREVM